MIALGERRELDFDLAVESTRNAFGPDLDSVDEEVERGLNAGL